MVVRGPPRRVVNYPNRFIVEFEIPEPGIWLNWALTNQPAPPYDNPNPGVFALNNVNNVLDPADPNQPDPNPTPLQPAMITSQIASALASRWRVQGITSPPDAQITVGNSYTVKPDNTGSPVLNDSSITVPTGYVGVTADIQFAAAGGDDQTHATEFYAMVGDIQENWSVPATSTATAFAANATKLNFQSATYTGVIPVSFWGFYVIAYGLSLNVTVVCQQANLDGNGNGTPIAVGSKQPSTKSPRHTTRCSPHTTKNATSGSRLRPAHRSSAHRRSTSRAVAELSGSRSRTCSGNLSAATT